MTSYCTQDDLEKRYGAEEVLELSDRDRDDVVDAGVLEAAISAAGNLIDSYIAKRYDLPLLAVPSVLVDKACDIARYNLHKDVVTDTVQNNYKDAVSFLRDVAAGRAELDAAGKQPASQTGGILIDGPDREFTSDTLKDYK